MAKRTRNNRFNVEWVFARKVAHMIQSGEEGIFPPPVPNYQTWEVEETGGKEKLVKETPITPMKVSLNGVTVFG